MGIKVLCILFLALALVACGDDTKPEPRGGGGDQPAADAPGIPDTEIGLVQGSIFDTPEPPAVTWVSSQPKDGMALPALFVGAPPRIPHGVTQFLPIEREENGCLECHWSEDEEDAPQLPESHLVDLRAAPDVVGTQPAGARWACVLCHVLVSDAEPLTVAAPAVAAPGE